MIVRLCKMPGTLNEPVAQSDGTTSSQFKASVDRAPKESSGITFASQDKLPKLPIPELGSTCAKYINAVRPLQSEKEHADTATAVEEFLKNDGRVLDSRLKEYASDKTSYIEQFCTLLNYTL